MFLIAGRGEELGYGDMNCLRVDGILFLLAPLSLARSLQRPLGVVRRRRVLRRILLGLPGKGPDDGVLREYASQPAIMLVLIDALMVESEGHIAFLPALLAYVIGHSERLLMHVKPVGMIIFIILLVSEEEGPPQSRSTAKIASAIAFQAVVYLRAEAINVEEVSLMINRLLEDEWMAIIAGEGRLLLEVSDDGLSIH